MRKFAVFSESIFVCIVLAGIYGVLHDQVTYTIAPEYFTRFKYHQFGFEPALFGGHRQTVAVIGFLATWWTGLFIGFSLGLTGLIYKDHKLMRKAIRRAVLIVFCVALAMGLAGFLYGKLVLAKTGVDWWMPENLADKEAFIAVGSTHNFSYLGGLTGLITCIVYLVKRRRTQYAKAGIGAAPAGK
ncbi:MAG TPA: hypothetical protein VFR58_08760 [Flavisolibacter sp.]|nr:hypothetical protein [Flavisolibacter sp.]